MNAAGFMLGLERIMGEMIYQVWFDNKGSAAAKTARVLGRKTAQLPLLQEPLLHYVLTDYGYDDDKKGISINMISASHTPPQQMSKDMSTPWRVLALPPAEALEIGNLWRMLGSTVKSYVNDTGNGAAVLAHRTDFKAQWLELNALLNKSMKPEECIAEVTRLLKLYQVLCADERKIEP